MPTLSRMPQYDVRNDGAGPYAVFYCESCSREYRSQPEVAGTVVKDIGRKALGGLLRNIPVVGGALAGEAPADQRYTTAMTPQQIEKAWGQVSDRFRECPTCQRIVCLSEWDEQSGFCNECSPRQQEIAEAEGQQAGAVLKGFASALGLGAVAEQMQQGIKQAAANVARCPKDGTVAPAGTKFCPECGSPMTQPAVDLCPSCGKETHGAKFCPECGAKIERKPAGVCPKCGAQTQGAKFCPECGTKQ